MTDTGTAWLADLEKVVTDIEALIREDDERAVQAFPPEQRSFWLAVRRYGTIAGHPDTLEALRAAASPGDLDGITLVPIAFAERGTLYAGEVIAKPAGRVQP